MFFLYTSATYHSLKALQIIHDWDLETFTKGLYLILENVFCSCLFTVFFFWLRDYLVFDHLPMQFNNNQNIYFGAMNNPVHLEILNKRASHTMSHKPQHLLFLFVHCEPWLVLSADTRARRPGRPWAHTGISIFLLQPLWMWLKEQSPLVINVKWWTLLKWMLPVWSKYFLYCSFF